MNHGGAGHDVHGLRHHDPLCPPGIKPDHEKCLTCMLLRRARAEERGKFVAVAQMLRGLVDMPINGSEMSDHQPSVGA
jgi:hypothetical protein